MNVSTAERTQHLPKEFTARGRGDRIWRRGGILLLGLLAALLPAGQIAGITLVGWNFVHPLPQGNHLYAAYAFAPDDLFVGGDGGTICHWDGSAWTKMETPTTKTIRAIHGLSNQDIWAVGGDSQTYDTMDRALILHYDGTSWTEVPAPVFLDWTYPMTSVHAVAEDDVFATIIGGNAVAHWDGSSWEFVYLPLDVEGEFNAIDSVNPDHVFIVGTHGQIVHRDRGTWVLEQKTETGYFTVDILQAVWAPSLDLVRAGGNYGQIYARKADGTWETQDLNSGCTDWACDGLFFIGGTGADDIYLVGPASVRHFDGTPPPIHRDEYSGIIRGGWSGACMAGDRLYMVGAEGVVHEYVFDDASPGGFLSPLTAGRRALPRLRGIGAAGYGDHGFLVYGNTEYTDEWPLNLWDGTGFVPFPSLPEEMPQAINITAATAAGPDDVVVSFAGTSNPKAGTYRWDGTAWSLMGPGWQNPRSVVDFWREPDNGDVYALMSAFLWRFDGTNWIHVAEPEDVGNATLTAIWGRAADDLFVGCADGRMWHYDGASWLEEPVVGADASTRIVGIAGTADETYAVATGGLAFYRNATGSWHPILEVTPREGDDFQDIVASDGLVYACQTLSTGAWQGQPSGTIWSFSGNTGEVLAAGLSVPLQTLVSTGSGAVYGLDITNGRVTIMADRPVQEALTLQRMDLSSADWTEFGWTDLSLKPDAAGTTAPMVAVWSVPEPASFLPGIDDLLPGARLWAVLADQQMLPALYGRFDLDPGDWPEGFDIATASLYRHGTADAWNIVDTTVDAGASRLETTAPVEFSSWTYASSTAVEPVPFRVESIGWNEAGDVEIRWTDRGEGTRYTVYVSDDAGGTWEPAPGTWPIAGTSWADPDAASAGRRFYRVQDNP